MVDNGKTGDVMQLGAKGEESWKGPWGEEFSITLWSLARQCFR